MTKTLPLAPQGVFLTVQGEGSLSGLPMVFVRLAGCSVGCKECDTDYSVHSRKTAKDIVRDVVNVAPKGLKWVWVTGGEPTINDLHELIEHLHLSGFRVALASAGIKPVGRGTGLRQEQGFPIQHEHGVDFLSVSPHRIDESFVQRRGDQVNLVFGLNDLTPDECEPVREELEKGFTDCWVTPCEGKSEAFQQCLKWVYQYPRWRINSQAHKYWRLP